MLFESLLWTFVFYFKPSFILIIEKHQRKYITNLYPNTYVHITSESLTLPTIYKIYTEYQSNRSISLDLKSSVVNLSRNR